jgi:hypothetical protein
MENRLDPHDPFSVYIRAERKFTEGLPVQIFIAFKESVKTIILEADDFHYEGSKNRNSYDEQGRAEFQKVSPQFGKVVVKVPFTGQEFGFDTYEAFIREISGNGES